MAQLPRSYGCRSRTNLHFRAFLCVVDDSKGINYIFQQSYDRKRLVELIRMSIKDNENGNGALSNELKIAVGAMEIADKVVSDVMTKLDVGFSLP